MTRTKNIFEKALEKRDLITSLSLVFPGRRPSILALDPGETTGLCLYVPNSDGTVTPDDFTLRQIRSNEPHTVAPVAMTIEHWLEEHNPSVLIWEAYRVYANKTKQHTWSSLYTPRLIGALELVARRYDYSVWQQTAQEGKAFVTDEKLKMSGLYDFTGNHRHARDGMRHALHYAMFSKKLTPKGS